MVLIMAGRLIDRALGRILPALVCLYAPYAWLVLMNYPWDSYRWYWIKTWPVPPGILVHANQTIHLLPDWIGYLIMAAVTAGIFASITILAVRSRRSAIIVSVIVGLLSSANSWIAYQLFLF